MFNGIVKKWLHRKMREESNSSLLMFNKRLDDSHMVPDIDPTLTPEEKADIILSQLTFSEKAELLGGTERMAIKGIPRLKIPKIWTTDASAGVRCFQRATAFPVPIAMAASWNREMLYKIGETIGKECRAKGVSVLLGPGVNIYRVPTAGRNFEYFGEDPFLSGEMAVSYIKGVQSKGVIATVKHFACNNSEYDRHKMNSKVDERTLREIYLPAFKSAIQKGGVKSVMSAYNPVNGVYASENRHLLTEILRDEWGFDGYVVSDWISVYSTVGPLKAGLDLEMPEGKYLNLKTIQQQIDNGLLNEADIDRPVRNLLKTFFEAGVYHRPLKDKQYPEFCAQHSQISLDAARESIVLLKNEHNFLPLNKSRIKKMIIVGEMAQNTTTCGGGSCRIKSHDSVSILEGIKNETNNEFDIEFLKATKNRLTGSEINRIASADVVLVSVGFTHVEESECYDKSWDLPDNQARMIGMVAGSNPNTIITLTTGSGVETESWISNIPAVLHCFFLGEKGGTAVADVLFGKVNPSGKLPFTMAKKWSDFGSTKYYVKKPHKTSPFRIFGPPRYPIFNKKWDLEYKEKLMVGYRHFDTQKIEPQFPFGFGLSFTEFVLSDLELSHNKIEISELAAGRRVEIRVQVTNSGNRAGSEVVQLYVRDVESSLIRPDKELKGFGKIYLEPGESKFIEMSIGLDDFSFFNSITGKWVAEPGEFRLLIGNSSQNILFNHALILTDKLMN